ncbi:MAG TPA: HAMP domain-containing sensor histidine kinase [Candidatus Aquilonibacter sp.]
MTLRTRLAWTYGIAVAAAVAVVAIVSFAAIDGTLRSSLDARLQTTASAIAALVDVHHDELRFDAEDREQMTGAVSSEMNAAIFTAQGTPFVVSTMQIPVHLTAAAKRGDFPLTPRTLRTTRRTLRTACRPIARGGVAYGYACVWQNAQYIDDVDRDALVAIALAAAVAGGVVIVLSTVLARRALAPLGAFSDLATEIEAHDLSRRVRHGGDDELGRLGSAFDRMLDRLESAFARQRRFAADASHELRAPLAVMRAEADAALEREREPAAYQAALHSIVAEIERIDATVDALLLAARADSARQHFEPVDLDALAAQAAERFAAAAAQRGIAIEVEGEPVTVQADAPGLERALAAILHNALDFAGERVTVETSVDAGEASVAIGDDGPGFSPQALAHATERFWRGDRRGRSGTGLGLAIAEAIVRAHGGRLELSNRPSGGACVRVCLPFI